MKIFKKVLRCVEYRATVYLLHDFMFDCHASTKKKILWIS